MPSDPMVAESGVMLQQPEVHHVFSWGSCSWITGTLVVAAAQVHGRRDVDSDLCLLTGFLVAAAALASHVRLWCLCW